VDYKFLREQLRVLLRGHEAHVDWPSALRGLPKKLRGAKPKGASHSAWELLEHVHIAQWDILDFCRNAKHVSPDWPSEYWPKGASPRTASEWDRTVKSFRKDMAAMIKLVTDPKVDLAEPIAHGSGQNILREALLLADHNSYHLGQLVQLRRLLGSWPET
jgi:DinB superfamily